MLFIGIVGASLATFIDSPWLYLIPAFAIGDFIFELGSIQSTKQAISDLSVTITENALIMGVKSKNIAIDYPWSSLRIVKESNGEASITIEDKSRRRSRVTLAGFEQMNEMIGEIRDRSDT